MKRVFAAILMSGLLAATAARADTITGTYTPGDSTTGTGPWVLTATDAPTDSFVALTPDQTLTFAQLTSLSASFFANDGDSGSGGGSPRISVGLDNGGTEEFLHIYLGNSPNYTDNDTVLDTYSGFNVIGNNDAGRYDDSQFGGSPFTTYADAVALVGGLQIEEVDFVSDTFGNFGDRSLTFNGFDAEFSPTVPVPAAAWMGLTTLGAVVAVGVLRQRQQRGR